MSDILSQAEIEALLSSLADSQALEATLMDTNPAGGAPMAGGGKPSAAASRGAIAYELYDFRRPDKFSKEQLRTLQMMHDTFARHAATGLSAYLRSSVSVELVSLEQIPFEEYLKGVTNSVFAVTSMPPLSGQCVLEMEFPLIFALIDRLLGGPGREVDRSTLTDIERPLVKQMLDRLLNAVKTAWEGIVIVNPNVDQLETTAQFVQIAPPNDIVVAILFEVKIGNLKGALSICIPYIVLKPITPKLSAQKWFVSNARKSSNSNKKLLSYQVANTQIDCAPMLGKTRINIKHLLSLAEGDVLPLKQKSTEDLVMMVSKTPKFYGKPGISGSKVVFTITGTTPQDLT